MLRFFTRLPLAVRIENELHELEIQALKHIANAEFHTAISAMLTLRRTRLCEQLTKLTTAPTPSVSSPTQIELS